MPCENGSQFSLKTSIIALLRAQEKRKIITITPQVIRLQTIKNGPADNVPGSQGETVYRLTHLSYCTTLYRI